MVKLITHLRFSDFFLSFCNFVPQLISYIISTDPNQFTFYSYESSLRNLKRIIFGFIMADIIFEILAMSICSNFLSTSSSSSTRMTYSGFVVICFSFVHNMRIFRFHGLHVLVKCINIHGIF